MLRFAEAFRTPGITVVMFWKVAFDPPEKWAQIPSNSLRISEIWHGLHNKHFDLGGKEGERERESCS